jgi:hypothetical protein
MDGDNVNAVVLNDRRGYPQFGTRSGLHPHCSTWPACSTHDYKNRRQGYLDALLSFGITDDSLIMECIRTWKGPRKRLPLELSDSARMPCFHRRLGHIMRCSCRKAGA